MSDDYMDAHMNPQPFEEKHGRKPYRLPEGLGKEQSARETQPIQEQLAFLDGVLCELHSQIDRMEGALAGVLGESNPHTGSPSRDAPGTCPCLGLCLS